MSSLWNRPWMMGLFALLVSAPVLARPHHPTRPRPTPSPAAEPAPSATPPAAAEESAPPPQVNVVQTPSAPAAPSAAPPPSSGGERPKVDLESLNTEYQTIRDELFRARAKVEMLGAALFKARMVATFQYKAQRAWPLKRVTLRVDDQPVYSADALAAEEPIKIYEGAAAPGRHAVSVRVECGAQGDARLSYAAEDTFVFDAPENKQARVELVVDETGDGPQSLGRKHEGTFDVRVRARIRPMPLEAK